MMKDESYLYPCHPRSARAEVPSPLMDADVKQLLEAIRQENATAHAETRRQVDTAVQGLREGNTAAHVEADTSIWLPKVCDTSCKWWRKALPSTPRRSNNSM